MRCQCLAIPFSGFALFAFGFVGCGKENSPELTQTQTAHVSAAPTITADAKLDSVVATETANQVSTPAETAEDDLIPMRGTTAQWPRLLGSDFDGVAPATAAKPDYTKKPQITWTLMVGDGYGLGSVSDEVYYHFDATREGRQLKQRLRAIELKSGTTIWSVEKPFDYADLYGYESGPRGTPAIAGDRIVTFGVEGELTCRDRSDGKEIWSVSTNEKYGVVQNFFGVGASPLILDQMVIVPVGGSPPEDQAIAPGRLDRVIPNGTALVAFDLSTGEERWHCGDDLAGYSSPRTMQIDGSTIILAFCRDHLIAVDPSAGKVLWKHHHRAEKLESVNAMMPVVDSRQVFISECYDIGSTLLDVDRDQATVVWKDESPSLRRHAMRCHWSTPVLIDGYLYGCSGRNNPDSDFRCIEFATGKLMWEDGRRRRSSVTRVGAELLIMDEFAKLQVVHPSPDKFDLIAEHDFNEQLTPPCWAAPIAIGNRVLIRGDRRVLCLAFPE
ncbi:PQQ-like beta-propeller repeat protein [Stieleria sp. JC731]|uniref:PQQ-binding-like beta-propeller repeat protein n=1 Tax=Pirellulaceae TaxID=2691357 RepID=UPI001E54D077|nr:PQQ-binding-like beta-propeller repeat protein [Stieleria sp. JC731]MCC9602588.1 PQQ-like beta-propeller repeat protein [Stieleria sp. JC731]